MGMTDAVRAGKDLYAHFDTSEGKVVAKLFPKDAPKTVENFVGLATGEWQSVLHHRGAHALA
jgi:peptidyl-prolyl cis-trans isomerase A (cyclophilin A)